MSKINSLVIKTECKDISVPFLRACIGSFCVYANPTVSEVEDIKTAVSEIVTNCLVHAYSSNDGIIEAECVLYSDKIEIIIKDEGVGIEDINQAMEPFFSTKSSEEHCGMGLNIVMTFMDEVEIDSGKDKGTSVKMVKRFKVDK